jgi:phage terminase large subunit-like protein
VATATRRSGQVSSSSLSGDPPADLLDFADFCSELTLDNGKPFVLEDFQRTILTDFFEGTTVTLVIIPKKNGKTTLVAALGLFHLLTTEDADAYIAASSRDQAGLVLKQARKFLRSSPELQNELAMKQREIVNKNDEGFLRVVASDEHTADGAIPTLAIVDELHRHKNTDLMGVFRDGLGPRNGQMIVITTAGDDSESALGQMRSQAYAMPTVEQDGAYRYARSSSGEWVMHEWALDDDQDREDMEVVKTANPASWHTTRSLAKRRNDPSTTPWQWARFACGVWLQGEDTAIGPVEWSACGIKSVDEMPEPSGRVRIGLDIGTKEDTTAAVVHWIDENDVAWLGACRVLVPPAEKGVGLRKSQILEAVSDLATEFGATEVVLDPETGGWIFGEELEDEFDLDVIAHSQKPAPMTEAAERFYTAVREEKIRHPRDPVLTRHVLNAHRRSTDDGRWRFVKENKQSHKHIDALIAAAMVHNVAIADAATLDQTVWLFD